VNILLNFVPLKSGGGMQVGLDFVRQAKVHGSAHRWYLVATAGTPLSRVEPQSNFFVAHLVPRNALGEYQGQSVFTHGVELGVTRPSSRNLEEATDAFVTAIVRGNPGMRSAGAQRQVRISQRAAIGTPLVGRSALNYTERVGIYTTFLADGSLFYYLTVAPEDDAAVYDETFDRVGSSIRLNDR